MDTTIQDINNLLKNKLKKVYSNFEIQQLRFIIYDKILNVSKIQSLSNPNLSIDEIKMTNILKIIDRLLLNEPIEYIVEETNFFDFTFKVNPAVLIPRPETEELVDWIIKSNHNKQLKILDIGTGSGCIAISLNKNLANSVVYAVDISDDALTTALANNKLNNAAVNFISTDILNPNIIALPQELDVIVSNPPYVRESEKELMEANVLEYEPSTALFVNDDDPLIFYDAIAKLGTTLLKAEGQLYFEINEALAEGVAQILKKFKYRNVEIRKDINGKNRMVKAIL